eukprot:CAMPEP_0169155858 /NCGR_PEP_ID=MMETSP1015-20121227/53626_1 /TAXON_ID=342587 /ORGANISM="Karlodinium micrum, Strain CCMP2283" /LENGTH=128 /DNA_ID=CAMNT_0009226457 /DNA_START=674 /DNA_END=1060 /DNA_ORIENTATION=-
MARLQRQSYCAIVQLQARCYGHFSASKWQEVPCDKDLKRQTRRAPSSPALAKIQCLGSFPRQHPDRNFESNVDKQLLVWGVSVGLAWPSSPTNGCGLSGLSAATCFDPMASEPNLSRWIFFSKLTSFE